MGFGHQVASRGNFENSCLDFKNNTIREGDKYATSNDPCHTCTCVAGAPDLCISVLCQLPRCDIVKQVEGKCCEFECSSERGNIRVPGLVSCFILFSVLLYFVQIFSRQKLKSIINNLHTEQGKVNLTSCNRPQTCVVILSTDNDCGPITPEQSKKDIRYMQLCPGITCQNSYPCLGNLLVSERNFNTVLQLVQEPTPPKSSVDQTGAATANNTSISGQNQKAAQ